MAIPFVVPSDDQAETNLTKLLCDLIEINQQVQILLRSRVQSGPQPVVSSRVYMSSPRHLRNHPNVGVRMPDLVNNLPFTSVTNTRTEIVLPASQNLTAVSARHPRRQRTCSESSCCEQSKYCIEENDMTEEPVMVSPAEIDWSQVGVIIHHVADDFLKPVAFKDEESQLTFTLLRDSKLEAKTLLSKFLPTSTSSCSIWTAVICGVVGWHIFRGR